MSNTLSVLAVTAFGAALLSGSAFAQDNAGAMTSDHMSSGAMASSSDHMSSAHASGAVATGGKKTSHKTPAPPKAAMAKDGAMSTAPMSSTAH